MPVKGEGMTNTLTGDQLCDRIDEIIAERSLLKHPFYQVWQKGELTMDALRGYACQYYHHVEAFPRYVSGAHTNCDNLADRQELLENLVEEESGPKNHPELWIQFGEALGLDRSDMTDVTPLPETAECDETFTRITRDSGFVPAIAALYAYESQVPEVAGTKMEGLKEFYGINTPDALRFFVVHHSLDVEHSRVTREMVARHADTAEKQEAAIKAVEESADALLKFLDGVTREYIPAAVAA
jgi:pyrroloquinoline-quinone synthase